MPLPKNPRIPAAAIATLAQIGTIRTRRLAMASRIVPSTTPSRNRMNSGAIDPGLSALCRYVASAVRSRPVWLTISYSAAPSAYQPNDTVPPSTSNAPEIWPSVTPRGPRNSRITPMAAAISTMPASRYNSPLARYVPLCFIAGWLLLLLYGVLMRLELLK